MVLNKGDDTLKKPDIYRDTGLRYLGYIGSLGWVCRAFLPFQMASMVSVAYVCADIFDKASISANCRGTDEQILMAAADTFAWHFFASLALPGVLIHGVNGLTSKFKSRRTRHFSRFLVIPCLISSFTLPFFSRPMDNMVDYIMDTYVRKHYPEDLVKRDCQKYGDEDSSKKANLKYKWFFDQSRDQHDLELERYREKLRAERNSENGNTNARMQPREDQVRWNNQNRPDINQFDQRGFGNETIAPGQENADSSNSQAGSSTATDYNDGMPGLLDKAVQVDKTTKPPKPPQQE